MCPWVTPSDPPGDLICRKIWLPDGADYEAAATGAILQLAEEKNWEAVTGQSAEDVAEAFFEAFNQTILWRPCMPLGSIIMFAGEEIPDGWLNCDGTLYPPGGDKSDLFDVIGYRFGQVGQNFKVPDLHQKFVRIISPYEDVGSEAGQNKVTLVEGNLPPHNHSIPSTITTLNDIPLGAVPVLTPGVLPLNTGNTGSGNWFDNKPEFMAMRAIINFR